MSCSMKQGVKKKKNTKRLSKSILNHYWHSMVRSVGIISNLYFESTVNKLDVSIEYICNALVD